MFYFQNIRDISDSRAVILLRCILFDCKLNFEFSEIFYFEVYSKTHAKIHRNLILNSLFYCITSMTHTNDFHVSFASIFFSRLELVVITIYGKFGTDDSFKVTQSERLKSTLNIVLRGQL